MKCCRCDHCLNPKEVGQQTELRICENCGEVFCDQCPDVGQNWYADGILDTLIETAKIPFFIFRATAKNSPKRDFF